MKKKKKICLISSSGGHYEQLLMLKSLEEVSNLYIVTEKTKYKNEYENNENNNEYLIEQINRREKLFILKLIKVFFQSLLIYIKEKPDVIISTGALCSIPTFFIGKIFKKKLIFIESFAKTQSPTMTGKIMYRIADVFIVQWKEMKNIYPDAVYLGSIY